MQAPKERSTRTPGATLDNAFTPSFLSAHRASARGTAEGSGGTASPSTTNAPATAPTPEPVRSLCARALFAGPWEVERIEPENRTEGALYAVVRRAEPMAEGGGAVAVLRDRTTALLLAAALSALAAPSALHVNTERQCARRRRHGLPLHDGRTFLGHLTPQLCPGEAEAAAAHGLLAHLHALRSLAANPDALALLVEALAPEVLPVLGRALVRRVSQAG